MMQRFYLFLGLIGLGLVAGCTNYTKKERQEVPKVAPSAKKMSKYDRMDLAWKQEYALTRDPNLRVIPKDRLEVGQRFIQKQERLRKTSRTTSTDIRWRERGPSNVGGRTRAILVDPNDASGKTVFAAGVSGGLWKTTDITLNKPVWNKVDDFFDNLAIVTIAADPSNPKVIYFGTGEGWGNFDAVRGGGIWKTTDGGISWGKTPFDGGNYIQKIAISTSGEVYAGTRSGLFKSTNQGGNWTKLAGLPQDKISDVEIGSNGTVHVGLGIFTDGSYRYSTNGGANWNTPVGFPASSDIQRVELAVAPSNANVVYAMMQGSGRGFYGGYKSTNGGANWTAMGAKPADADTDISASDFTREQAWYDLIIAVDPNNENTIITGGIDLFKSTNGGDNWTQISKWSNNNLLANLDVPLVHADHHTIIFLNSDKILFGNDGGIYYTEDGSQAVPTITSKENGYNTSQFYSCALHPTAGSNYMLGGTQDNGSQKLNDILIGKSVEVTGGDGGFAYIDQNEPTYQFTSFTFNNWYRSSDGGLTFTKVNHALSGTGSFINPTDYDNDANILYAATNTGSYLRWNDPQTGNSTSEVNVAAFGSAAITHIAISPNTVHRVFFGLDNGNIVRVDNAHTSSPSATTINAGAGMPNSASVSCVAIEKGNDDHLLVTYSNYGVTSVWETTDGGTTWFNVEGNLPDIPVRWALFNPNNSKQAMLATELGVWFTEEIKGINTTWVASNNGLANVRVDMLQIRDSDNTIIAGTHGRGMFSTDFFASTPIANFLVNKKLNYAGIGVTFTDLSAKATSWSWDFGDGTTSTLQNPTHAYTAAGVYNVKLTINGTTTKTINNAVHILPNYGTPYTLAQGGNFESNPNDFGAEAIEGSINPWERGTPSNTLSTLSSGSNAWKTDLDADIVKGDYKSVLQTPNFNFSASGTYTIRFKMSMETQFCSAPQGANLEYSTDNGVTWQVLGAATGNPVSSSNWYQQGPSKEGQSCGTNTVTDSKKSWSFDGNNVTTVYDASALAGKSSVAFRFVFQISSNHASGYAIDGIMIDDFEVNGPSNDASHFASINASGATEFCDGGKVTFQANAGSGYTYQWQKDGVDIANATSDNYETNTAGAYKVLVTSNGITVASQTIQVLVKSSPLPVIQESSGTLSTTVVAGASYQWFKSGTAISGATNSSYTPTSCGTYTVQTNYSNGCSRSSASYDYNNTSLSVSISNQGNTLTASVNDATTYTWFLNGEAIANATSSTLVATQPGVYKVSIVKSGCPTSSPDFSFDPSTDLSASLSYQLALYPNPVNKQLRLRFQQKLGNAQFKIFNAQGAQVKSLIERSNTPQHQFTIDVSSLPTGVYLLQLLLEDGRWATKRFYKR
ncbi:PKD domain-containing protein [uncultured Microscilla sp.]|uniref:PKD domain-containing protein n=1 Tax=uncultured Microscilla sp. TaxID=432653 RepID=UPI002611ED80|nr:PKD domain-containing protein [uncultured Microscilla sp.]